MHQEISKVRYAFPHQVSFSIAYFTSAGLSGREQERASYYENQCHFLACRSTTSAQLHLFTVADMAIQYEQPYSTGNQERGKKVLQE